MSEKTHPLIAMIPDSVKEVCTETWIATKRHVLMGIIANAGVAYWLWYVANVPWNYAVIVFVWSSYAIVMTLFLNYFMWVMTPRKLREREGESV